jgi:DNA polymerase I-like protein with 3'-5' exonuclease and polymerase domains
VWDEHAEKKKMIGPHTLMNLGYSAGVNKGDFGESAGWEVYTEEMLEYCVQDVRVNVAVFHMLVRELGGTTDYAINLEMDVAAYLAEQQTNGWVFDIEKAMGLYADLDVKLSQLEDEVHKTFKPLAKHERDIQPRALKNGGLSSVGLKFLEDVESLIPVPSYEDVPGYSRVYSSGEFSRISWPEFNLGSRQQIAGQFIHRGWKPTEMTDNGNIIINEPVLEAARTKFKEASLIADYFMISKRMSMVDNWVKAFNEDTGRLHGYVNTLGAVTRRMTHSGPNLAQVPATKCGKDGEILWGFEGSYGADCRALFTVPDGYVQVGCDASGLELRCLAHYMNDQTYTDLILHGDIHTYNQNAAGLPSRNDAKTFIYAFLYGAGDAKIGSIVGAGAGKGKSLKAAFLKNTPALKNLRDNVSQAAERGWLKTIDGGRVRVRHAHAALNSLLQSCGAIVMKVWLRLVMQRATQEDIDFKTNGNIHDEGQFEVLAKDVEAFNEICLQAMIDAGEELNFRCPLAGDVKAGSNWALTH